MTADRDAAATWLILGASSSIGRAFARRAAAEGCDILLAGRDIDDLPFDAEAVDDHPAFVADCAARTDELNVLLLFGAMPDQADIDGDFALALRTVQVNYVGAMSVLSRLAPILEARGRGRVVVLSSVAGDRGRPKNYVYGSAKGALNIYLQGLRARLWRSGVPVVTVKAGFLDTDMTFGMPGLFLVASPEQCAEACLRFARKGCEVVYFPAFWWLIMTIIKLIPERIFKRLDI